MTEETTDSIDIQENLLMALSPDLLNILLRDNTMSSEEEQHNIFWATGDYEHLGPGYEYHSPILPELITGQNGSVIMPRVKKHRETQAARSRGMAEVFTPSWVCNAQNNLIDEAWFGRKDVFNREITTPEGRHTWQVNEDRITFPEGKTWKDYVRDIRMEITCGEAPYLVSRYDTTTGCFIPVGRRIGLLDRKLRIIGENTVNSGEWLKMAHMAFKSIYAYEWQGDNLLLAREALLWSFIEYYREKFGKDPGNNSLLSIARTISWNVWQMDGLKGVVPDTCKDIVTKENDLLEGITEKREPCPGCANNVLTEHTGAYCLIMNWRTVDKATGKKGKRTPFIELIN